MTSSRMMISLLAACLGAASCARDPIQSAQSDGATAPLAAADATIPPAQAPADSAQPVSSYKDERKARALSGIDYSTGRAVIDPAAAAAKVTVEDPALAATTFARAQGELAENYRVEAVDSFTRAVLLDPKNAAHWSGLGDGLLAMRMVPEAIGALTVALELAPTSSDVHYKLGDALARSNDRPAAIAKLQRAIDLDASNGPAHERLAVQLYYTGDHAGAWREVHACDALDVDVAPQFRVLLAQQMPEPTVK